MRALFSVARKEVRHLFRDPATLAIALAIPILQLTIFGFAIDFEVKQVSTVVADLDHSRASRELIQTLQNTQVLDVSLQASSAKEALELVRQGRAKVAIIVPPDYSRRLGTSRPPQIRAHVDGSDSTAANAARSALSLPAPGARRVDVSINVLYNPDLRTETFVIPGLIGVILQLVTLALTSFSLVKEKEQGTLEQLSVSPLKPVELILGKLLPYAVLAMVEVGVVLAAGWLLFDVTVRGSLLLLLAVSVPFVLAALSLGLLISTIAKNQGQALMLTLMLMLPSILMSGFVFSRDQMPGPLWVISEAFPVTHYLLIIRGIAVRGAGLMDVMQPTLMLILITTCLLALAALRFRKTLE
jgi:ABC-type multidrug transport system permease subunit